MEIQATATMKDSEGNATDEKISGTVQFDFGENLKGAVKLFGEDVVLAQFHQAVVVSLQGIMRRHIQGGKAGKDLQDAVNEWKPGVKTTVRKSSAEKLKDIFAGKSPEEIATILKEAGHG